MSIARGYALGLTFHREQQQKLDRCLDLIRFKIGVYEDILADDTARHQVAPARLRARSLVSSGSALATGSRASNSGSVVSALKTVATVMS